MSVNPENSEGLDETNGGNGGTIPGERPKAHRVGNPPKPSVPRQLLHHAKETMFPDDPYHQFKGQTTKMKWILGLQYVFPLLSWLPNYELSMLKGDIAAGLTIACLSIPESMGNAKLADLPPIIGLYSNFVPPLVYAVMGTSRDVAVGPVALVSILMASLMKNEVNPSDPDYVKLAFTVTFFAGIVQAALGLLRLGFIIDYLSHAALVGFAAGAAVVVSLSQLKGFFGIDHGFTTKTDIVSVFKSLIRNKEQWTWETILLASVFLVFLISAKIIGKKKKSLFWITTMAPLFSLIVATAAVYITHAHKHKVKVVGQVKRGLNPLSIEELFLSGKYVAKGFHIGAVVGLIALSEAVAVGRTFAALGDYHIDGSKEMLAFGLANIVGSTTSCYVATGAFARTAVSKGSGCNSALSNVVMSSVILLTLLVLTPLIEYIPISFLSAIIIAAVISLINIPAAKLIWKTDKSDFLVMMGTFFGVLFISVKHGLLFAIIMSFGKIIFQVTRPHTAVLGKVPGTYYYGNTHQYPDANTEPGILIIRIDSSIYFANANYIRERILRYVVDEVEKINKACEGPLQFVLVDLTPVQSVDTTSLHVLEELNRGLKKQDLQMAFSNPGSGVIEKFEVGGLVDLVGPEWFFLSVGEAVQVLSIFVKEDVQKLDEKRKESVNMGSGYPTWPR
ncbi:unnamed protein product [Calypogeia fissa]